MSPNSSHPRSATLRRLIAAIPLAPLASSLANALGYPAPGRQWGLEFTYRFGN